MHVGGIWLRGTPPRFVLSGPESHPGPSQSPSPTLPPHLQIWLCRETACGWASFGGPGPPRVQWHVARGQPPRSSKAHSSPGLPRRLQACGSPGVHGEVMERLPTMLIREQPPPANLRGAGEHGAGGPGPGTGTGRETGMGDLQGGGSRVGVSRARESPGNCPVPSPQP